MVDPGGIVPFIPYILRSGRGSNLDEEIASNFRPRVSALSLVNELPTFL
jgi:hypothetical protein